MRTCPVDGSCLQGLCAICLVILVLAINKQYTGLCVLCKRSVVLTQLVNYVSLACLCTYVDAI